MFGAILPVSERTVPSLPTPESNIFQAMWSNRRIRAVIIILNAIIVGLTVLHFAINIDTILGPTIPPNYSSSLDINTANLSDTKEVYAFYLSTPEMDQHYLRSALVLIYALKRDPKFQDPDRNVVVLVSSQTSTADILALQDAGAGIHPIPDYVDAIEDMDDVPRNFYLQAYTYSKTWLWAMACERVLYINANIVLNKPLRDVWIDAHAWPASGLSAIADTDKDGTGDTFGEGFMLLRPDKTIYKELRKLERMEDSSLDQVGTWSECRKKDDADLIAECLEQILQQAGTKAMGATQSYVCLSLAY